jgi:Region found in RelA / SpoT proteins
LSYRMTEIKPERFAFDFEAHRKAAVEKYNRKRDSYRDFAETIHDILADAIRTRDLRVNEIQMRAKTVDSFGKKAMTPKKENSDEPKYKDPLAEITDLAGVRVITFFPRTVDEVGQCIQREFEVIEKVDHTATTQQEERLGYQSVHYLVRLAASGQYGAGRHWIRLRRAYAFSFTAPSRSSGSSISADPSTKTYRMPFTHADGDHSGTCVRNKSANARLVIFIVHRRSRKKCIRQIAPPLVSA